MRRIKWKAPGWPVLFFRGSPPSGVSLVLFSRLELALDGPMRAVECFVGGYFPPKESAYQRDCVADGTYAARAQTGFSPVSADPDGATTEIRFLHFRHTRGNNSIHVLVSEITFSFDEWKRLSLNLLIHLFLPPKTLAHVPISNGFSDSATVGHKQIV